MPPKKKPTASKKPAKKDAKRLVKKPKPKPRAPINRNSNSVRDHIINGGSRLLRHTRDRTEDLLHSIMCSTWVAQKLKCCRR